MQCIQIIRGMFDVKIACGKRKRLEGYVLSRVLIEFHKAGITRRCS